ncbi:DUF3613 domain-containing protein [Flagellatimonas centrodinii]|uniref:DUF3613 domain-containing protein n=1 Tax=Flagellatimonas centrodinii TaxID=2806210 RepID=UPI001FF031F8|nr:DUF3613 domain-containing protein [Flagellatimonas centrodinii]ULQ45356.1 DUF3613 domain-containing protein [Flagellatimonas centrodinii]
MTTRYLLLVSLMVGLPAGAASPPRPTADGEATRAWLAQQKGDVATVPTPQAMPGDVADRVYQRYLDSFSHPIPEAFSRDKFNSGSQSR